MHEPNRRFLPPALLQSLSYRYKLPSHIEYKVGNSPLKLVRIPRLSASEVESIVKASGFKLPGEIIQSCLQSLRKEPDYSLESLVNVGHSLQGCSIRKEDTFFVHRGKTSLRQTIALIYFGDSNQGSDPRSGFTLHIEPSRPSKSKSRPLAEQGPCFDVLLDFFDCNYSSSNRVEKFKRLAVLSVMSALRSMERAGSEWGWRQSQSINQELTNAFHGDTKFIFDEEQDQEQTDILYEVPTISKFINIPSIKVIGEIARRTAIAWESAALKAIEKLLCETEHNLQADDFCAIAPSRRPVSFSLITRYQSTSGHSLKAAMALKYQDPFNRIAPCDIWISKNTKPNRYAGKQPEAEYFCQIDWRPFKETGQKVVDYLIKDLRKRKLITKIPANWNPDLL